MDSICSLSRVEFPWGVAALDSPVEPAAVERYSNWLAEGRHGDMAYLEKYGDLRADPRLLLEGAQSIVAVAFPYYTDEPVALPVSLYARGRDYHEVVREYLTAVAAEMEGQTRVCVDTAPLRERYWAVRAGLGFIGRNNQLIIPGLGSYFFLGFILTTEKLPVNGPVGEEVSNLRPPAEGCGECRRCVDACPGAALSPDGSGLDARRCLSYLTIEHRGPIDGPIPTLYGCDVCQRVCPHNAGARPTPIADFHPSDALRRLTPDDIASMTPEQFSALFRHSAIKRTKLAGLQRNLAAMAALPSCVPNVQTIVREDPSRDVPPARCPENKAIHTKEQYRKSPRAKFIDYDAGAYFITICTRNHKHHFGTIYDGVMRLSELGAFVNRQLEEASRFCSDIEVPLHVVMPNHIHAIVCIRHDGRTEHIPFVDRSLSPALRRLATCQRHVPTLSRYVNSLKGATTKFAREKGIAFEWQSRYHDHTIRNRADGNKIAHYILNNVAKWDLDKYNPSHT